MKTWCKLTKPQQAALLELLASPEHKCYAGRQFIAYRALVSMGLASNANDHNCFYLRAEGEHLARFGKAVASKETKAQRVERLYREAMKQKAEAR